MIPVKEFLKINELESTRPVHSNLVSPRTLFIIRALFSLYILSVIIVLIIIAIPKPIILGVFLTNFGYYGLAIYLWVSTYLSLRYYLNPTYRPFQDSHWFLHFLYQLSYEAAITFAFFIFLVYWALLAKLDLPNQKALGTFHSISCHLLNFIMVIFEFLFGRNLFYVQHYPFFLLLAILYICLTFLIHQVYGFWVYPFLDYQSNPLLFGLTIGAILLVSIIHTFLVAYLHRLRDKLFARYYHTKANW